MLNYCPVLMQEQLALINTTLLSYSEQATSCSCQSLAALYSLLGLSKCYRRSFVGTETPTLKNSYKLTILPKTYEIPVV